MRMEFSMLAPRMFLKGSFDNDGLYKLLGSTSISSVCESITLDKHVDVNTSLVMIT